MNLSKKTIIVSSLSLLLCSSLLASEVYTIENSSLENAIKKISKISNMNFMADTRILKGKKAPSIKNISGLKNALKEVLKNTNLEAIIKDKTIIIRKKELSSKSSSNLGEVEIIENNFKNAYGDTKGYLTTNSSTGSKMDMDITEIPQSISVITKDLMEIRNAQTIQQALAYTSAIAMNSGENGWPGINLSSLRGGNLLYNSTFLDGLKLANTNIAIPSTDMYAVEKVEILKGPSSVLYGASSPGGLLNLQSKRANSTNSKEILISSGTKQNNTLAFDINNSISEDVFLRLTAKYNTKEKIADGYKKGKSYFFNSALKYYLGDDTTLDFLASYSKEHIPGGAIAKSEDTILTFHNDIAKHKDFFAQMMGNPAIAGMIQNATDTLNQANIPSTLVLGQKDNNLDKEMISFATLLNHKINDSLEINSKLRFSKLDGRDINTAFDASQMFSLISSFDYTKVPLIQYKDKFDLKSFAMDTNIQYKWDTQNIQNTSMLGLDIKSQKSTDKRHNEHAFQFDLLNPDYKKDIGSFTEVKTDKETKVKQIGLYAQNQAKINNNFIVSTALRYDTVKQEDKKKIQNTSSSQSDHKVSGRLGLAYIMNSGITPYISYSTSFVPNIGNDKDGNSFIPSVGKQIELGVKYKIESLNGLLTSSIYQIEETNIVSADPSSPGDSIQDKNSLIKAFELDLTIEPIENLNIIISYTKMSSEAKDTKNPIREGKKLNGVADSNFAIWSDYTFKKTTIGNLNIGAGVKYIGGNRSIQNDVFDLEHGSPVKVTKIDSYTLADARIGTTYKNMNFAFNVANIFDKQAKINPYPTNYRLTRGRTYNFSLKYAF
ncbi:MAG: TonB-dependent siderophore receptor [Campylobacteraceae bacterium]|nr:TonB-dependent siderophore receptor [Campylobacteraceae bacterium]